MLLDSLAIRYRRLSESFKATEDKQQRRELLAEMATIVCEIDVTVLNHVEQWRLLKDEHASRHSRV